MSKRNDLKTTRRRFLTAAAAGGAVIAMPQVSRAQTVALKMQGSWGKADVFNEMAEDYVKRVNEMAGGRLRIDYLVGGAVVHPFQVFDGVHGGQIDAAHTVPVYWYGKHKAASLFGTGPVFGFNANEGLGWIHNGGGYQLFEELQILETQRKQSRGPGNAAPLATQAESLAASRECNRLVAEVKSGLKAGDVVVMEAPAGGARQEQRQRPGGFPLGGGVVRFR